MGEVTHFVFVTDSSGLIKIPRSRYISDLLSFVCQFFFLFCFVVALCMCGVWWLLGVHCVFLMIFWPPNTNTCKIRTTTKKTGKKKIYLNKVHTFILYLYIYYTYIQTYYIHTTNHIIYINIIHHVV